MHPDQEGREAPKKRQGLPQLTVPDTGRQRVRVDALETRSGRLWFDGEPFTGIGAERVSERSLALADFEAGHRVSDYSETLLPGGAVEFFDESRLGVEINHDDGLDYFHGGTPTTGAMAGCVGPYLETLRLLESSVEVAAVSWYPSGRLRQIYRFDPADTRELNWKWSEDGALLVARFQCEDDDLTGWIDLDETARIRWLRVVGSYFESAPDSRSTAPHWIWSSPEQIAAMEAAEKLTLSLAQQSADDVVAALVSNDGMKRVVSLTLQSSMSRANLLRLTERAALREVCLPRPGRDSLDEGTVDAVVAELQEARPELLVVVGGRRKIG